MATPDRSPAAALAFWRALAERPYDWHFFAALRHIEALYPDKPRFGRAVRPADEPARFAQTPAMHFAPSMISKVDISRRVPLVENYFLGLFGPNGPLPLHLTEYALDRDLNEKDATFRRFADIFHHRLLSLMYRAWAQAQPTVSYDRPNEDRFGDYVGALFGLDEGERRGSDARIARARRFYSGRLAQHSRPAEGLRGVLEGVFGVQIRIQQFVGRWMRIPRRTWLRLGTGRGYSTLGGGATLGEEVWACQQSFRIVVGPLTLWQFSRFLPGGEGRSLQRLTELVRGYVGPELGWDLQLRLQGQQAPPMVLGKSGQLGWTSWLGKGQDNADCGDVVLNPAMVC
jgi:type VI secretion system protein ImpH